jgi:NTP pyrophosphohydrolases including oxidative damage repair enzymes
MITKAGVAIVKKIGGVWHGLVVLQSGSSKWGFPKGSKTYMREPLHVCAKRELAEEAGLFIELSSKHQYITIHNTAYFVMEPSKENIKLFQHLKTKDTKEIDAISWMPIQPNSTDTHHKSLIRLMELIESIPIETLSLPPKKSLCHQCIRSKWLPTTFFQKTN